MKRAILVLAFGIALGSLSSIASAQQTAAPYTFATRYNVAGQVTGTISPDPDDGGNLRFAATRNTYGTSGATAGLLVTTEVGELSTWLDEGTKPEGWSGAFTVFQTRTFEYDDQGRKSAERVKGKNGAVESLVQYSYDSWDRVDCRVVRMNAATFSSSSTPACSLASPSDRITKFTYDDLDQVLTETRGLLTPLVQTYVTNTYQARGQLKTQKDANGNITTLEYENGRLKKRVYPWSVYYNSYTYDNNGNVKTERKRNGSLITYTYDANNRLTFKHLSDNANSQDISYGYDLRGLALYSCFGNVYTTACDASGEGETNKFDGFGNLEWRKSRMFGTTRQLFYQYDLEGNRTRITHPDGVYFTYGRDGLNRVCTLGESASAPDCDSAESDDYLAIHYSAEGRRADIVRPGSVTGYATDNALRLDVFTQSFAATANNLSNGFDYNAAGQITSLTQSNTQYNYTEAQNRVGAYGVNDLNQYTSIDGVTVTHDANGNLTADGAGMTYFYDMENRLVSTGMPASGLYYDVLGRLARVTVAGTTTDFHYDGDALVGEYVGSNMTRRYVHSGEVDEPLVQYTVVAGVATKRYLHADHQGSIIAHSDNAGAVAQKNSYDPYGVPKSTNDGRFGYTGQTWLKELGLNYYKARFYAPRLGRFLQTDPIFYSDNMNMYAYVGNDPINRLDPFGMQEQNICDADPSRCLVTPVIVVDIDPPTSIDPETGDLVFDALPPGVTEDQVSTTPEGKRDTPDSVDTNAMPTQSKIPDTAKNTPAASGVGPIGLEATLKAWDAARAERDAAQRRGDLDTAKRWDAIATARMFDYNKLLPGNQSLKPELYTKPTPYGR